MERKKSGKGVVIQNHGGHLLEAMAGWRNQDADVASAEVYAILDWSLPEMFGCTKCHLKVIQ